ncbi:hypothetical protein GWK47_045657 [Chionoecetes opilio]|uniref:Uncharacterized protein n=1 Tax=Chionoecetes opilio TaxID=41210 RepID=A0A8J4Y740_CHIOP|nr:hypothetical protein GWK47_045657 [Chionoecetes opilio]
METQDGGRVGWTFTPEERRREGEVFHSPPWVVFDIRPLSGRPMPPFAWGSVFGGEELEIPRCFPVLLGGNPQKGTSIMESFKDPMSGPEEELRLASKTSLGSPRGHDGGRPTKASSPQFFPIRMQAPFPARFRSRDVKQKAMILSLTPPSPLSFKTLQPRSASRIPACRDPPKELGVFPP